jgi:Transglutaminase-like superfamily
LYALSLLRGPRDWLKFTEVCVFAAAVPAMTRLPLPRLAALLTRPSQLRAPQPAEIDRLERVTRLAPRILRPLVRTGCLTRGLTLFWFLRHAGVDVELRFGLDAEAGRPTDAHCWLTLDGEPYLEQQELSRFAELYRLPLASGA